MTFHSKKILDDSVGAVLVQVHKLMATGQFRFFVNMSSICEMCGY